MYTTFQYCKLYYKISTGLVDNEGGNILCNVRKMCGMFCATSYQNLNIYMYKNVISKSNLDKAANNLENTFLRIKSYAY